ncbi:MAG TPA: hypothetical protein VFI95_03000 [Terriglobales bacterium]|nr:hypothetical protein [Terriglobales bacterium]
MKLALAADPLRQPVTEFGFVLVPLVPFALVLPIEELGDVLFWVPIVLLGDVPFGVVLVWPLVAPFWLPIPAPLVLGLAAVPVAPV